MTGPFAAPRALDHCVLPTADLVVAASRLGVLGFTVAPKGVHPFGTANRCVYFSDGTFLEPLATHDQQRVAEAKRAGNVFVARYDEYRSGRSAEGFSALVFASGDAAADHAGFVEARRSAGAMLEFSREAVDAFGNTGVASFRLAFAADRHAPDCLLFTCERVNAPAIDRSGLQRHANGVTAIRSIVLTARIPEEFEAFLHTASGARAVAANGSLTMRMANCAIQIVKPDAFLAAFDHPSAREDLQARAIVFEVANLPATESHLVSSNIKYRTVDRRLIIDPAPGQGAIFVFEENV